MNNCFIKQVISLCGKLKRLPCVGCLSFFGVFSNPNAQTPHPGDRARRAVNRGVEFRPAFVDGGELKCGVTALCCC